LNFCVFKFYADVKFVYSDIQSSNVWDSIYKNVLNKGSALKDNFVREIIKAIKDSGESK